MDVARPYLCGQFPVLLCYALNGSISADHSGEQESSGDGGGQFLQAVSAERGGDGGGPPQRGAAC